VNDAQKALLARLRELIDETPKSGASNAAGNPLYITRFAQAIERRSEDGAALVKYVRSKLHGPATDGYSALIEAGRPDLTVEAVVADPDAAWATEFDDDDRAAARERLGTMLATDRDLKAAAEALAVAQDRRVVAAMNDRRAAGGRSKLTPEQEASILARRAAERASDAP
jgi:hypothetical protein